VQDFCGRILGRILGGRRLLVEDLCPAGFCGSNFGGRFLVAGSLVGRVLDAGFYGWQDFS